MTEAAALELLRATVMTALIIALPILTAAITVGLAVAFFQAITSLQDQTLSAVPKAFAVGAAVVASAPFSLQLLIKFTVGALTAIQQIGPS